jgi:hypothetical protein
VGGVIHGNVDAGKQRANAERVRETADRAFAVPLAVIAEAQAAGDAIGQLLDGLRPR